MKNLWPWIVAHKAVFIPLVSVLLANLITVLSKRPNTEGLIGILRSLLDILSQAQHSDSPEGRFRLKFLRRSTHPQAAPTKGFRSRFPKACGITKIPPVFHPPLPKNADPIQIALVDFGNTGVDAAELPKVAAALNRQVNEHFALAPPYGYGIRADIRVAQRNDIQPEDWVLGLFEKPDVTGALGYHDRTPTGTPVMKVFPKLDSADGSPWSVTASHEVLECLADPELARATQAPDGRFYALEVADPCESDVFELDGVKLSNWCSPLYWEPIRGYKNAPLDYMGLMKTPLEVRPGGYTQIYNDNMGWQQVFADKVRAMRKQPHGGRSERRRVRAKKG